MGVRITSRILRSTGRRGHPPQRYISHSSTCFCGLQEITSLQTTVARSYSKCAAVSVMRTIFDKILWYVLNFVLVNVFKAAELHPTYTSPNNSHCLINSGDIKCDTANKLGRVIHYLVPPNFGHWCFITTKKQTGLKERWSINSPYTLTNFILLCNHCHTSAFAFLYVTVLELI